MLTATKLVKKFSAFHGTRSVEAGSNTSTLALSVVGGDEKGSLESKRE
jgi:hypothetical protein